MNAPIFKYNTKDLSKPFLRIAILEYLLAIILPLSFIITEKQSTISFMELMFIFLFCFILGTISLLTYLHYFTYQCKIFNDYIIIQTIYKKRKIEINSVKNIKYGKIRTKDYFKCKLFLSNGKTFTIITKNAEDFINLLKKN